MDLYNLRAKTKAGTGTKDFTTRITLFFSNDTIQNNPSKWTLAATTSSTEMSNPHKHPTLIASQHKINNLSHKLFYIRDCYTHAAN